MHCKSMQASKHIAGACACAPMHLRPSQRTHTRIHSLSLPACAPPTLIHPSMQGRRRSPCAPHVCALHTLHILFTWHSLCGVWAEVGGALPTCRLTPHTRAPDAAACALVPPGHACAYTGCCCCWRAWLLPSPRLFSAVHEIPITRLVLCFA